MKDEGEMMKVKLICHGRVTKIVLKTFENQGFFQNPT